MEVRGPDGAWRADVMASDPGGAWRMALEAQLAPITAADITARTEQMAADGVPSIWFSDRPARRGWVPCRPCASRTPTTARGWLLRGPGEVGQRPVGSRPGHPGPVP